MLRKALESLFGESAKNPSHTLDTPRPEIVNPEFEKTMRELGIEQIVNTIQQATGHEARITETVDPDPGYHDPRVTFGPSKDTGFTRTTRSFTIPLRTQQGRALVDIYETQGGMVRPTEGPPYYEETQTKVGEEPSKHTQILEDNVTITLSQRTDLPGESLVTVGTMRFNPLQFEGKDVLIAQSNGLRMNIDSDPGARQTELLQKITGLLENIDKS